MGLFDQLQNVLTQYAGGNTPGPQNPQEVIRMRPHWPTSGKSASWTGIQVSTAI